MTHTFVAGEAQARLDDPPKNFPADIPHRIRWPI